MATDGALPPSIHQSKQFRSTPTNWKVSNHGRVVVIHATSGSSAIKIAAEYVGKIELLRSDVRMPQMSGPDLAEILRKSRPDLRVMFMSGFRRGDLLVLNYGWAFIEKPFRWWQTFYPLPTARRDDLSQLWKYACL
jgi:DNA-binding NtrC family response regulator